MMQTLFSTRGLARLALFAGLWWLLASGNLTSLVIGLLVIPLAAYCSLAIEPETGSGFRISLIGAVRFVPYFIYQSTRGGWDTAKRAFLPSMPIQPALVSYRLQQLPPGAARRFFLNVVSLMPGSLAIELDDAAAVASLHTLNRAGFSVAELRECERRVGALFCDTEAPAQ